MSIVDKTPSSPPFPGDHTTLTALGAELSALRSVSKGTVRFGTFWHAVGQGPTPVVYIGIEYYILPMIMFYVILVSLTIIRYRSAIAEKALAGYPPKMAG